MWLPRRMATRRSSPTRVRSRRSRMAAKRRRDHPHPIARSVTSPRAGSTCAAHRRRPTTPGTHEATAPAATHDAPATPTHAHTAPAATPTPVAHTAPAATHDAPATPMPVAHSSTTPAATHDAPRTHDAHAPHVAPAHAT